MGLLDPILLSIPSIRCQAQQGQRVGGKYPLVCWIHPGIQWNVCSFLWYCRRFYERVERLFPACQRHTWSLLVLEKCNVCHVLFKIVIKLLLLSVFDMTSTPECSFDLVQAGQLKLSVLTVSDSCPHSLLSLCLWPSLQKEKPYHCTPYWFFSSNVRVQKSKLTFGSHFVLFSSKRLH